FPGFCVVHTLKARFGYVSDELGWFFICIVNAGLYGAGMVALRVCWRRFVGPRREPLSAGAPSQGRGRWLSRRRLLGVGVQALGGCAVAGLGYGLLVEPRRLEVTRRVIRLRGLPAELDGLIAVQITDVHHGPWLSRERVREIVETVNGLQPD